MTRVSTANVFNNNLRTLQTRQSELLEAQARLSSGKRVSKPSDDPAAAARAERAMVAESRADMNQRALESSRNAMKAGEAALGDAGELLQRAREQVVGAGNASWGPNERAAAAVSLRSLRDQLLGVANRDDGAGGFLFGGQGSAQPPFVDAPGGVVWIGATGTQQTAADEALPLTLDGQAAWLSAPSGNGVFETSVTTVNGSAWIDAGRVVDPSALTGDDYALTFAVSGGATTYSITRAGNPTAATGVPFVSGQAIQIDGLSFTVTGAPANGDAFAVAPSSTALSAFDAIDRTLAMLEDPAATEGDVTQAVKFGLRDLDAVMASMNAQRAEAGSWLQRLDLAEGRIADSKLGAQTQRSLAEDLDMAQAVSDFQLQQTSYDAALRSYSMVQRISLFNYIGS
jgi:flagellar hook-associated protein 3 FlgL